MTLRPLPVALLGALASCTVYAPTVPSTPLVHKGQVEVSGATRGFVSLDAAAAWSPAAHLLLTGEGAVRSADLSSTVNGVTTKAHDVHRQGSLGVGTYRLLGGANPLYLGAVGGVGVAAVNVHRGLSLVDDEYTANYLRYYGQVYLAEQGRTVSGGLSVRATGVSFSRLRRDNLPVDPIARFYLEPSVFVRVGNGLLQGQATLGLSLPDRTDKSRYDNSVLAASSTLFSVGLVFRPFLLKQPVEAPR